MSIEHINTEPYLGNPNGDPAKIAFEKANRNFLSANVQASAMPQAQFEAIRALNNEEYAASGFVHTGKHFTNGTVYLAVNEGLWTATTDSANTLVVGKRRSAPTAIGASKTYNAVLHIAGVIFDLTNGRTIGEQYNIGFPQAPDGKKTYNKSTGEVITHATTTAAFSYAATDINVNVVTDRVDMWGFESWLEEVNTTNPFIYQNGLIQSQATTMDGIATSVSARPVTYYAVFDGDTGSKGRGLDFFALTDAQKKTVLSNPKNNLYYLDDGRLVQWRLRQRTIVGAGNGDWIAIDSAKSTGNGTLQSFAPSSTRVVAQASDNTASMNYTSRFFAETINTNYNGDPQVGLFTTYKKVGLGYVYFLVCGTVNRLNQGAYHPSYNPSGSAKFVGDTFWYNTSANISSKADCFDPARILASSGTIASAKSGRPDNRYYDAIYASGEGGVCRDMRYSAQGVDNVDFAIADQNVKNSTYRGFEKPIFSKPYLSSSGALALGSVSGMVKVNSLAVDFFISSGSRGSSGGGAKPIIGYLAQGVASWIPVTYVFTAGSGSATQFYCSSEVWKANGSPSLPNSSSEPLVFIEITEQSSSVGGSFMQIDVVGKPANIALTPQLANGWQGSWLPVMPNGTFLNYIHTRKKIAETISNGYAYYTGNNGASWAAAGYTSSGDNTKNTVLTNINMNPAHVVIFPYQAFAKQTENTVNAAVHGGNLGVGDVYEMARADYSILMEFLIGKVGVSSSTKDVGTLKVNSFFIEMRNFASKTWGMLLSGNGAYNPSHPPIDLVVNNNSPACKTLNYNVNINQQAFIQYAYTELKHNGTSWGDDGKQAIVDNQSTKTDLNGNTVLVGTAKLKEPIGWIKNKA